MVVCEDNKLMNLMVDVHSQNMLVFDNKLWLVIHIISWFLKAPTCFIIWIWQFALEGLN